MLTGAEILEQIDKGNIQITPFNEKQINPNSYNLTLGDQLFVYTPLVLDSAKVNAGRSFRIPKEGYVLVPGCFYLAETVEYTVTENFIPQISGRSSIGRLGLGIHMNSGLGAPGYKGRWSLGLTCVVPLRIYPGMQIGQIYYFPIE